MGYEPPPFMPCEPVSLGVGVVFNLLKMLKILTTPHHSAEAKAKSRTSEVNAACIVPRYSQMVHKAGSLHQ